MLNKRTLKDICVKDKKVLVRVDFNVPMSKENEGEIANDIRIQRAIPTIKYLIDNKAKVIIMSHMGRPKGIPDSKYSLEVVAKRLAEILKQEVKFLNSEKVVDEYVKSEVNKLKSGEVALLQNTRFRAEETQNDENFAKELASLGEIFVNDAFGTCHREHASNVRVAKLLPSALGFLVEKEVEYITDVLKNPEKPFVCIMGGAKISDKIGVVNHMLNKADSIIIGGGMSYTFLKALGKNIGKSIFEEDKMPLALEILKEAEEKNIKVLLPKDVVIAKEIDKDAETKIVSIDNIPDDMEALDMGPETVKYFTEEILKAKTAIWNGPMGVFEVKPFSTGTYAIAEAMAKTNATTIVGGGDSTLAIEMSGNQDKISYVSTGGGASLKLLEGKPLIAILSISDK